MSKIALVTGYSSLLGQQIAQALLKEGYVVYGATRNASLKDELGIKQVKLDITSSQGVDVVINKIITSHKRIDVVVNVAGNSINGAIESLSVEEFLELLQVNLLGTYRIMKAAIPHMKRQMCGRIINITSLNGFLPSPGYSHYSASKHALQALSTAGGYELKKSNVHITCVAPGALKSTQPVSTIKHKPAREAFPILKILLPMATQSDVANKIIKSIKLKSPNNLILIGRDAQIIYVLQKYLPSVIWNTIQQLIWGIQK